MEELTGQQEYLRLQGDEHMMSADKIKQNKLICDIGVHYLE